MCFNKTNVAYPEFYLDVMYPCIWDQLAARAFELDMVLVTVGVLVTHYFDYVLDLGFCWV